MMITATVLASGQTTNTATVSATTIDPNSSNNTSSVGTTPVAQADLSMAKTVSNGAPNVGSNVTFTITVTNLGPSSAANVQVSDVLPAGYTFVSATPSVGSYSSATGVWNGIGTLALNASATLTITATVQPAGPYLNTATASTTDQRDQHREQQRERGHVAGGGRQPRDQQDRQQRDVHAGRQRYVRGGSDQRRAVDRLRPHRDRHAAGGRHAQRHRHVRSRRHGELRQRHRHRGTDVVRRDRGVDSGGCLPFAHVHRAGRIRVVDDDEPARQHGPCSRSREPARVRQRQQHTAGDCRARRRQDRRQRDVHAGRHRDLHRHRHQYRSHRRRQRHGCGCAACGGHAHRQRELRGNGRRDLRRGHGQQRPDELRHHGRNARRRCGRFARVHRARRICRGHGREPARQYRVRHRPRDGFHRERQRFATRSLRKSRWRSRRPTAAARTRRAARRRIP